MSQQCHPRLIPGRVPARHRHRRRDRPDRRRGPRDVPTLFCQITVVVRPDDSFRLTLNPPCSDEVRAVVRRHGGLVTEHPTAVIELDFPSPRSARPVLELAAAVRGVTARGRRYPDPKWKWVAPRTADSLLRFARLLAGPARRTTTRC